MEPGILFFFAAILIVGGALFAFVSLARSGVRRLDVERYRSRWLAIEKQLVRDSEPSYHLAILNADKLLDHALRELGTRGNTMGERMKVTRWSDANAVWSAHKLRNRVAHEPDVRIDYGAARQALAGFKQGLKDIGAI